MRSNTGIKIIFCCLRNTTRQPAQVYPQIQPEYPGYKVLQCAFWNLLCNLSSGFSGRSGKEIHFQGGFVLPL